MGVKFSAGSSTQYVGMQRQSIINGGFSVNQRVVSGTVTLTAGQYGHDRWKAGASGCTYTFATVNNITTITITAGSLIQVIEGSNLFSGSYTLSWTGTSQGKIGAGSFGATGIAGNAVGGTNLNIEFNIGTLSKVQFNAGAPLPFQPKLFSEEFEACRRYYRKSFDIAIAPGTATGVPGYYHSWGDSSTSVILSQNVSFNSSMRAAPTVTLYDMAGTTGKASSWNGSVQTDGVTATANSINETRFRVAATVASGNSQFYGHYTAEAEL